MAGGALVFFTGASTSSSLSSSANAVRGAGSHCGAGSSSSSRAGAGSSPTRKIPLHCGHLMRLPSRLSLTLRILPQRHDTRMETLLQLLPGQGNDVKLARTGNLLGCFLAKANLKAPRRVGTAAHHAGG